MTIRVRELRIGAEHVDTSAHGQTVDSRSYGEVPAGRAGESERTGAACSGAGVEGKFFGVYPAIVQGLRQPEGERASQVQLRFPWLAGGEDVAVWARYASPMAGPGSGVWFLPEVGDEVLVAFEAGDLARPYVIGALWNGVDRPPEEVESDAQGSVRSITTRGGIRITVEDVSGGGEVTIETPNGASLRLADGHGGSEAVLRDGLGNEVSLEPGGVVVRSPVELTLQASRIKASAAFVELQTAMCTVSGVIKCETLIADSVVGGSYTPGAGNVW